MSKGDRIRALHYSKERIQCSCISFIEDRINNVSVSEAIRSCNQHGEFKVHRRTLYRWWCHYENWGELPVQTSQKIQQYTKFEMSHLNFEFLVYFYLLALGGDDQWPCSLHLFGFNIKHTVPPNIYGTCRCAGHNPQSLQIHFAPAIKHHFRPRKNSSTS